MDADDDDDDDVDDEVEFVMEEGLGFGCGLTTLMEDIEDLDRIFELRLQATLFGLEFLTLNKRFFISSLNAIASLVNGASLIRRVRSSPL